MLYEFQSEDGQVITRSYPMSKAPPLGKVIVRAGRRYRRILSRPASVSVADHSTFPMVSHAAPKLSGTEHVTDRTSRDYGKVIFNSPAERDNYCRRNGYLAREYPTDRDIAERKPRRAPMPRYEDFGLRAPDKPAEPKVFVGDREI